MRKRHILNAECGMRNAEFFKCETRNSELGISQFRIPYPAFRICFLLFLAACNVTKRLPEGQAILSKNRISIEGFRTIPDKYTVEAETETYLKQQPAKPFLGVISNYREWVYLKRHCAEPADSISFKRWKITPLSHLTFQKWRWNHGGRFRRWRCAKFASPPVIYDEALTLKTEQNLLNYLRNRGYFNAEVWHDTRISGKKAKVKYVLVPNQKFTVDSFKIVCGDSAVLALLKKTAAKEALVRPGVDLDVKIFDAEKARIVRLLKNEGYASFVPNFLDFEADTVGLKGNIVLSVLPFSDTSTQHPTFQIGKITFQSDYNPRLGTRLDTTINGIRFLSSETAWTVRPSVVLNALTIQQGQLYREENLEFTNRRLGNLGVYRFVGLRPAIDTASPFRQNMAISVTKNQRFSIGTDFDFNYTNNNSIGSSNKLLGGFVGGNIRSRNLAGKAIQLSVSAEYSLEFAPFDRGVANFINTQEFTPKAELIFPKFIDYLGIWRLINQFPNKRRDPLSGDSPILSRLKNESRMRMSLAWDYRELFEFYNIKTLTASAGYELRGSPRSQYSIRHFGLDALLARARPRFQELLNLNPFLAKSFDDQLLTGLLLREFGWRFLSNPDGLGGTRSLRVNLDFSGVEVAGVTSILNNFQWRDSSKEPSLGGLPFAQFVRAELEMGISQPFLRKMTFAGRIVVGSARPFGSSSSIPYLKQFSVGGPYSMRGWTIRQLGPGGYNDPINETPTDLPFYQTGDFKFEMNGEWRFPIWWVWTGAAFVDAGNVWTWKNDPTRPGSDLKNFGSELAMNTGLGIRADFGFFIIRSDWGLPLRNNFRTYYIPPGSDIPISSSHWIYGRNRAKFQLSDFNWNLAIGLPF